MSESQMESVYTVNPARPTESAIHSEVYSPTSQWSSFEKLNGQSNGERNPTSQWASFERLNAQSNGDRDPSYLEMGASDIYDMDWGSVKAPEIGDPNRPGFRQDRQVQAIFDGLETGEIDSDELTDLAQEQKLIAAAQEYFGADGLSDQELKGLDQLQNSARQHILDAGGADELEYACKDNNECEAEKPEPKSGDEKESEKPAEPKSKEKSEEKPEEKSGEEESEEQSEEAAPEESAKNDQNPSPEEQFQKFLKFLDQDGDGQISLTEILQAFQAMDSSKDGVVSAEEFEKFMAQRSRKDTGNDKAKPEGKSESPTGGGKEPSSEPESGGESQSESEPGGEQSPEESGSNPEESTNDGSDQPDTSNGERYPDAEQMKMIYIFPDSQQVWQKLNQDAPAGSMIVTLPSSDVSWDSDQPFNSIDPQLKANIAEASANGLNPMGYVGTRGATRPIDEVKAEIDSWYENADIKGIYLGDSGNHDTSGGYHTDAATEAYFQELGDYIQAKGGLAAVNGSGSPNPDYVNKFIQGTHEGYANAMPESKEWQDQHSAGRFAAMLVGVEQQDIGRVVQQARENHNGYVFIAPEYGQAPTANDAYWNEVIRSLKG